MSELIRFDHVGLRYGALQALRDVSFSLPAGGLCALCGPNGAGKSSLLRLVCGLQRPSEGDGIVLGEWLSALRVQRRARIGYMAQHTVLYDELSVAENLRFRAAVMGLENPRGAAKQALALNDLQAVAAQPVGRLSGGWRQRVAWACARLARPALLLLDEPTAGLDAEARARLWRELRELAEQGVSALVSTHDPAEAALCDQLLLLHAGHLRFAGTPQQHWSAAELQALQGAAAIGMGAPS